MMTLCVCVCVCVDPEAQLRLNRALIIGLGLSLHQIAVPATRKEEGGEEEERERGRGERERRRREREEEERERGGGGERERKRACLRVATLDFEFARPCDAAEQEEILNLKIVTINSWLREPCATCHICQWHLFKNGHCRMQTHMYIYPQVNVGRSISFLYKNSPR